MEMEEYDLDIYHIPRSKSPPDPMSDSMRVSVSTYPPLGQVTQLKTNIVSFVAVLETYEGLADEAWEVSLWHSGSDVGRDCWVEAALTPSRDEIPSTLSALPDGRTRLYFTTRISVPKSLAFTARFRSASDQDWIWARDSQGTGDGTVIINHGSALEGISEELKDLIKDLNPELRVKKIPSQAPRTKLWLVEASVNAAEGDISRFVSTSLGTPWGTFLR
jgi:hypothetical protein